MDNPTPEERKIIEKTKEEYPILRHRQIQGILQNKGLYRFSGSIYHYLKSLDVVEPFARRPSPLKDLGIPYGRKTACGVAIGTSFLSPNHIWWYLLILIDFFSRYAIAYDIYPSINVSHIKHIYTTGLKNQGIGKKRDALPELRVDLRIDEYLSYYKKIL